MNTILTTMLLATFVAGTAQEVAPVQTRKKVEVQEKKTKKPKTFKLGMPVDATLSLKDIDGKTHSFKDLRGKIVVINFWAYRCPAIRATQSRLSAIHKSFKDKGVVVLGINSDRGEIGTEPPVARTDKDGNRKKAFQSVRRFVEDRSVPYPILADHKNVVADLFRARTTPHMFVLDKKGVLRYSGALDDDMSGRKGDNAQHYVRDAINSLLAGKEVSVQSTRPYG